MMPQSAVLRRLTTPQKIQDFLDYELDFNDTMTGVCLSPFEVLKCRRARPYSRLAAPRKK